jgi:hypothetical protein
MRPSFDSEPHLKLSMHIKSIGFLPFSTSMMRKVMETPQVLEIVLNSPVFGNPITSFISLGGNTSKA